MPTIITPDDIRRTSDIVNQALIDYEIAPSRKEKIAHLKKAFVATCRLLKKILESNFFDEYSKLIESLEPGYARELSDLAQDHPALAILHDPVQFDHFLEFETELLVKAEFAPDYAVSLTQNIKQGYQELVRQNFTPANFRESISYYKEIVCNKPEPTHHDVRGIAVFLGGLALVAVDAAATATVPAAAPIAAALSGALGGAFVSQVAGPALAGAAFA